MSINIQKTEFVISAAKKADFPRDQLPQVGCAGECGGVAHAVVPAGEFLPGGRQGGGPTVRHAV